MSKRCPICHYNFETEADYDRHVPCPDPGTERAHGESEGIWPMGSAWFVDGLHLAELVDRYGAGLRAMVELYFREYTDATELEPEFLNALSTVASFIDCEVVLAEEIAKAEKSINASGGIVSHSDGTRHKVHTTIEDAD